MQMRHAAVAAGLAFVLMSGAARAATYSFVFDDTVTMNEGNLSGTFEVSGDQIIGISGSGDKLGSITGLLPSGFFPIGFPSDNAFSQTAPYLSGSGVSFSTSSGSDANLFYYSPGNNYVLTLTTTPDAYSEGTLSVSNVSAVPLPASAPLFGGALLALGSVGYGLKRKSKAAAAA